jgi:hypothetical protein
MDEVKLAEPRGLIAIMLFSGVYIQFAGRLFVAELFIVFIFLTLLLRGELGRLIHNSGYKLLMKLLILCQVAQIASDLYRNSQSMAFIRGFLLILFTILNLLVITYLVQFRLNRYLIVVILYSLSQMISFLLQPPITGYGNFWKFGFGYPLTAILFCWLTHKKNLHNLQLGISILILSGLDFALGARNLAGVSLIAGTLSVFARTNLRKKELISGGIMQSKKTLPFPKRSLWGMTLLLIVLAITLFYSYRGAALSGVLGKEAALKYEQQSSTNTNLIFASRTEVFGEYLAIRESPLIGHGSYAPLTAELRQKLLPWLLNNRLQTNLVQLDSEANYAIPVHSGIFAFWVWFGILAVPFFLYALWIAISTIRTKGSPPIVYYFAVLLCWDILFSPFGMYARMQYPLTLIGMIIFANRFQES